jgi:hypothetical protein
MVDENSLTGHCHSFAAAVSLAVMRVMANSCDADERNFFLLAAKTFIATARGIV